MGLSWLDHPALPEQAGTYAGSCIVACSAKCVWDDMSAVPNHDADIMCVNDMGIRFPGEIEHWYSSHADAFDLYRNIRVYSWRFHTRKVGPAYHHTIAASRSAGKADIVWPWPGYGNSGLNAIFTALGLGYGMVYVCGAPLDNSGHFNDQPEDHWLQTPDEQNWGRYGEYAHYRQWESAIENVFDGKVQFMSGRYGNI